MPRRRVYVRLLSGLWLALIVAWYFSARIVVWFPLVLLALAVVPVAIWIWIPDVRRAEPAMGEVLFSDRVTFRASRLRLNGSSTGGGRLLVGEETIATRSWFVPHVIGKLFGWNYTLHAPDFEVAVKRPRALSRAIGSVTFSPSHPQRMWDRSVVLRGPFGRSSLELEFFRSETTTPDQVRDALVRAGARAAD